MTKQNNVLIIILLYLYGYIAREELARCRLPINNQITVKNVLKYISLK